MTTEALPLAPVRPRRRWWPWVLGAMLLVLVGVPIGFHLWLIWRVDQAVAELNRQEPGWRMSEMLAAQSPIPDGENGALVALAASGKRVKESRNLEPGESVEEWDARQLELQDRQQLLADTRPLNRKLRADVKAAYEREMRSQGAALAEADRLVDYPRGRLPSTYNQANPLGTISKVQDLREVAQLLQGDALLRLERGDTAGALRDAHAAFNLARAVGDVPQGIDQLVRTALVAVALGIVERVLAQGEVSPAGLEKWQKLVREEDAFPVTQVVMRGERGFLHDTFVSVESGAVSPKGMTGPGGVVAKVDELLPVLTRDRLRYEHPGMLQYTSRLVSISEQPVEQQRAALAALAASPGVPGRGSLTGLFTSAADLLMNSFRRKHSHLRCFDAALAVERYRLDHEGRWPDSLEQLVPDYLPAVPVEPQDGQPLRYKRLEDGAVVYGCDRNGNNGGFKLDADGELPVANPVGVRLWDKAKRGLPALPRPEPLDDPDGPGRP